MCVEYAQLLSTAHRVADGDFFIGRTTNGRKITRYFHPESDMNLELYKATHVMHPSAIWARETRENYVWLYDMWSALCYEYEYRYGKKHMSWTKLEWFLIMPPNNIIQQGFFEPTPAMGSHPHCIVEGDSLQSYRNYYWEGKKRMAIWTNREIPDWWVERQEK
jgi:hypothetical protein